MVAFRVKQRNAANWNIYRDILFMHALLRQRSTPPADQDLCEDTPSNSNSDGNVSLGVAIQRTRYEGLLYFVTLPYGRWFLRGTFAALRRGPALPPRHSLWMGCAQVSESLDWSQNDFISQPAAGRLPDEKLASILWLVGPSGTTCLPCHLFRGPFSQDTFHFISAVRS